MSTALGYGKRELIEKIVQENWKVSPFKKMFNYNEVLFIIQEMLNEEGKFYFTRRKGLSGHHVFREFVKLLMYRNLANYDSMVLITADKGVGKSSAAMMIAREWCRMQGRVFDPKRHIAYNNSDVMQKIDMLDKYEPIICVSGNTKIRIKRNNVEHSVMIKNLVGKNNYDVLSYNIKENKFEYQKPKEVILTKKAITWVVELENGIKLRATPEHLFLTKNRGYVQLKNLNNDDEIVLQSRNCKICGKEFFNKRWGTLTCSKKCSDINIEIQIPYRIKYSEKSKKWYSKYHNEKIKNNKVASK